MSSKKTRLCAYGNCDKEMDPAKITLIIRGSDKEFLTFCSLIHCVLYGVRRLLWPSVRSAEYREEIQKLLI